MHQRFNPRPLSRADDMSEPHGGLPAAGFNPRPLSRADDESRMTKGDEPFSFNPRPLSRADDQWGSVAEAVAAVSIRVRSRERTISAPYASARELPFQSASALASGR